MVINNKSEFEKIKDKISETLWDKITTYFAGVWTGFWEEFDKQTVKISNFLGEYFSKKLAVPLSKDQKHDIENLMGKKIILKELKDRTSETINKSALGRVGYALSELVGLVFGGMFAIGQILSQNRVQEALEEMPFTLPDIQALILALQREPALKNAILKSIKKQGYDDTQLLLLESAMATLLTKEEISELKIRNLINEETHDKEMKRIGLFDKDISKLKKLYDRLPPINDMITMMVREVFDPAQAETLGIYGDYPEQFTGFAAKHGLSEDWAKKYWAMHWRLPSERMGFEMMHRGIIDTPELEKLLKALDIVPGWRDRIIKMSYSVFTRVDIRRMFKIGVMDRDEVKRANMDIGYDEEKAEKLTKFIEQDVSEEEREYTQVQVLNALKRGIVGQQEATEMLEELGYSKNAIDLVISRTIYDMEMSIQKRSLKTIETLFKKGVYDQARMSSELGNLNLESKEIDLYIAEWIVEKESDRPVLSLAMIMKMYKKKIYSQNEIENELDLRGYSSEHIAKLIAFLNAGGKTDE